MPTNARADLQFDFFLPETLSDNLWLASEVRAFSVDADGVLPSYNTDPQSSVDVDNSEMDSWQAPTTDGTPTPRQRHTTGRSDQSERTLASRDEHLPLLPADESADDRWGSDEVQDNYDLQVDQPAERAAYRHGMITETRNINQSHHQRQQTGGHQPSAWSDTNKPWTSSSISASTDRTTEPSTSPAGSGRPRQINPPLTMHYADYVRQISRMSGRIAASTSPPTTNMTTTSPGRRTGGRSRPGVTRPSSRRGSLTTGGRRTSTGNSSSECGRRCPRFRPGVRRQFCDAQFGESRMITNGLRRTQ